MFWDVEKHLPKLAEGGIIAGQISDCERKEDGTRVLYEELSTHVSSFEVGTPVKVQWRQGEDKRCIQRVSKIEE